MNHNGHSFYFNMQFIKENLYNYLLDLLNRKKKQQKCRANKYLLRKNYDVWRYILLICKRKLNKTDIKPKLKRGSKTRGDLSKQQSRLVW